MKRISLLMMVFSALVLVSCNSNSNLKGSDSAAKLSGASCGKVLADLYSQYKASGTIDPKSTATIKSVSELSTYYGLLNQNKGQSGYLKSFTGGLISASGGLVTKKNSTTVINSLLSMSGLGDSQSQANAATSKISTISSVLTNLFKTLKG